MAQSKQVLNQGESPSVLLKDFVGLSVKVDLLNRPKSSFQVLDNFDLYITGSIRKVLPAVVYGGPYGANLLNCSEYLAQPNNTAQVPLGGIRRLIGVGSDGKLYDLASLTPTVPYIDTSALLGSPSTIPSMIQFPGYFIPFNIRSWQASTNYAQFDAILEYGPDGQVYVFANLGNAGTTNGVVEPTWPVPVGSTILDNTITWTNVGIPNSSRFFAYFLCVAAPGHLPIKVVEWQYDPTSLVEVPKITAQPMGCPPATVPPEIPDASLKISPNLNGYFPVSGRAYQWTYYNPQTLQESSPSPFVGKTKIIETDNSNLTVTINGSLLLPLPPATKSTPYSSYQSFYVAIPLSVLNPNPPGYTCVRIYATKDGGSVFFLVNTLYDDLGNQISNSDGSIPISLLVSLQAAKGWTDYFPIPEPQAMVPSGRAYEGSGPINLAPDPVNLSPAAWSIKTPLTNNAIYVLVGGAPDGANAFAVEGPYTGNSVWQSVAIPVHNQPYYFQMYLDKTGATGGTMLVHIQRPNGTNLLTLTQADNTEGVLSGTFTPPPADHTVQIIIAINGVTIPAGDTLIWADPILQIGSVFNPTPTNYPTTDTSLILPAPLAFANNQPPKSHTIEIYLDAMFFIDDSDPSKVWYSQQGQYEKVGVNSFIRTTTNRGTFVMELVKTLDRLILMKERSAAQITSYPPTEPTDIDPQHGALSYRASIPFGAALLSLMTDGLGRLTMAQTINEAQISLGNQVVTYGASLDGDAIKPIIDLIDPIELHAQNQGLPLPSPAILNKQNLYLLALRLTQIP